MFIFLTINQKFRARSESFTMQLLEKSQNWKVTYANFLSMNPSDLISWWIYYGTTCKWKANLNNTKNCNFLLCYVEDIVKVDHMLAEYFSLPVVKQDRVFEMIILAPLVRLLACPNGELCLCLKEFHQIFLFS